MSTKAQLLTYEMMKSTGQIKSVREAILKLMKDLNFPMCKHDFIKVLDINELTIIGRISELWDDGEIKFSHTGEHNGKVITYYRLAHSSEKSAIQYFRQLQKVAKAKEFLESRGYTITKK